MEAENLQRFLENVVQPVQRERERERWTHTSARNSAKQMFDTYIPDDSAL